MGDCAAEDVMKRNEKQCHVDKSTGDVVARNAT